MKALYQRSFFKRNIVISAIIAGIYTIIFLLGNTALGQNYTLEWCVRNINLLFMIIAIIIALLNAPKVAVYSTIGYAVSILFGDTVGTQLYTAEFAKYEALVAEQEGRGEMDINRYPQHYGAYICIFVFSIIMVAGLIIIAIRRRTSYHE